jgi:protein-tyrosine phosphatase
LALIARPRGDDWLTEDLMRHRQFGFDVIASLLCDDEVIELGLRDEALLALNCGLTFVSFPIADYGVPMSMSATVEFVENLFRRLKDGETVGLHCRQSVGRSSLIAACLYVLAGESPISAFEQIHKSRGVRVPDTTQQEKFVESFAEINTRVLIR